MSLLASFELKEFNAASLTASYQNFGTELSNSSYRIEIQNDSDVDVYVSLDGTNNTWRVVSGAILPIESFISANPLYNPFFVAKTGSQLSIKQVTASGTGNIIANISTVTR